MTSTVKARAENDTRRSIVFPPDLPATTKMPTYLAEAAAKSRDAMEHPGFYSMPYGWQAAMEEAKARLTAVCDALNAPPIRAEMLVAWFTPIAAAVRNRPSDDSLVTFCLALQFALDGVPSSVLTQCLQREGMRRWQFFPSAAEVMEMLEPIAPAWRRQQMALADLLLLDADMAKQPERYRHWA